MEKREKVFLYLQMIKTESYIGEKRLVRRSVIGSTIGG